MRLAHVHLLEMTEACICASAAYALGVKCASVEYALGGQIGKTASAAYE